MVFLKVQCWSFHKKSNLYIDCLLCFDGLFLLLSLFVYTKTRFAGSMVVWGMEPLSYWEEEEWWRANMWQIKKTHIIGSFLLLIVASFN
jgi:hypothetical protein